VAVSALSQPEGTATPLAEAAVVALFITRRSGWQGDYIVEQNNVSDAVSLDPS
jgi:hypothetical protein